MRALTVIPEQPGSAAVTDVEEPGAEQGDVLVDGLALGVCGTDREIIAGEYGQAPAGRTSGWCSATSRWACVEEAPAGSGFAAGDLVVGDRPPSRPGALRRLRARRIRHVPQRPLQRARDQAARRLRLASAGGSRATTASSSTRGCGSVGMLMEPTTVVAKACRADPADRRGDALRAPPAAGHRRRPDRPARRDARGPARPRGARARPGHRRPQAAAGRGPRRDLPLRRHRRSSMGKARADAILEATGVGELVFDAMDHLAPGGIVCLTGISPAGGHAQRRRRLDQPRPGPAEQRRARLGQRQPSPLPGGRRGPGRRRPRLAGAADHPPGAAGGATRRRWKRSPTTSRS